MNWSAFFKTIGGAAVWSGIGWVGSHFGTNATVMILTTALAGVIAHWLPQPTKPSNGS